MQGAGSTHGGTWRLPIETVAAWAKAFIFENAAGLMRPKFRVYFEYIRLQLCHPELQLGAEESWSSHLRRLGPVDNHLEAM